MNRKSLECIDINSRYCPCLLAAVNRCLTCSQLQGKELCNCDWPGVCIFYEQHWEPKDYGGLYSRRYSEQTVISRKALVGKNTYQLEFSVSSSLAEELQRLGSFVFLRCSTDPAFFFFPVNVVQSAGTTITVIIEGTGPKSRRLLSETGGNLLVRGPYFNGILGQPWIDNLSYGKIILIAGGIGQAPALPIAAKLRSNNNEVTALLAPGKVGTYFAEAALTALGVQVHTAISLRKFGLPLLKQQLASQPDVIVSAGPDQQHHAVINALHEAGVSLPLAVTNNAVMCCGEGICGSCLCTGRNGETIRLCKTQTDFKALLED